MLVTLNSSVADSALNRVAKIRDILVVTIFQETPARLLLYSFYCSFKTTFIAGRIQVKVLPSRRDVFFLFKFSSICGTNCQSCGEILQNIDLIFFTNFLRKWNKINVVSAWTWIRPVFIKAKGHCRNYCHISVSLLQDSTIQLQVPRDLISCSLEFSAYPCFEIWPLC